MKNCKVVVFVPKSHLGLLQNAIGRVGAGKIGNYSFCSFVAFGEGYFKPEIGSNPYIGRRGKLQKVKEARLEFICPVAVKNKILKVIRSVHPYDEVVVDIYPLL